MAIADGYGLGKRPHGRIGISPKILMFRQPAKSFTPEREGNFFTLLNTIGSYENYPYSASVRAHRFRNVAVCCGSCGTQHYVYFDDSGTSRHRDDDR